MMGRLLTLLLPEPDLHMQDFWHFGDFRCIFLPNIGENQKKVLPSKRGTPGHRRSQGARAPPPNQNSTNDKKSSQHSLAMFSCSFFSVIAKNHSQFL